MFQIVVEVEHLTDEEAGDSEYGFKITVHLVGGDSSCEHEIVLGNLFAGAINQSQEKVMHMAMKMFADNNEKEGEHKRGGNGYESNGRGNVLH